MADVRALRRAVGILRHLSTSNRPVSVGAIVRALELPTSTAYDLLSTLDELGMVHRVGRAGYVLGPGVHELGAAYVRTNPLQRLAAPMVRSLAEQTAGTAQLAVLRGWETVYLLKEQSMDSVALITASGVRMPGYLTATGRAIMAHLPRRDLVAALHSEAVFVTRTGRGPRTFAQLSRELSITRSRGWAEESGEITPGVRTVAAAVFDAMSRPVAALGVSSSAVEDVPMVEGSPADSMATVEAVRAAADSLTSQLS